MRYLKYLIEVHRIYFMTLRMERDIKKLQGIFAKQKEQQEKLDDEFYDRILNNDEVLYVLDKKNQYYVGSFNGNS